MKEEIIDLLNRDFQVADIKEHLLAKGYPEGEIMKVLNELVTEKQYESGAVSVRKGTSP